MCFCASKIFKIFQMCRQNIYLCVPVSIDEMKLVTFDRETVDDRCSSDKMG